MATCPDCSAEVLDDDSLSRHLQYHMSEMLTYTDIKANLLAEMQTTRCSE